jgi:hypothetical protein
MSSRELHDRGFGLLLVVKEAEGSLVGVECLYAAVAEQEDVTETTPLAVVNSDVGRS